MSASRAALIPVGVYLLAVLACFLYLFYEYLRPHYGPGGRDGFHAVAPLVLVTTPWSGFFLEWGLFGRFDSPLWKLGLFLLCALANAATIYALLAPALKLASDHLARLDEERRLRGGQ